MAFVNEHYLKLSAGYLFPEIARRVNAFIAECPQYAGEIIRCGIGDVTEPLPLAAVEAMKLATDELAHRASFKGYGPGTGYEDVRHTIAEGEFRSRGIDVADDEIFLSDGSKGDCSSIMELFSHTNRIAITDPVYPAYVDGNVMFGNTGPAIEGGGYEGLVYLPCTEANGFLAEIPSTRVDIVYRASITRSFSTTLPTKPTFRIHRFRARSLRSKARAIAQWSSVLSQSLVALQACAAATPCCPSRCAQQLRAARRFPCIHFGRVDGTHDPTA